MSTTSPEHHEPEPGQDDPVTGEVADGDANPGDYMSSDQLSGVSDETGTVYGHDGEPEETPHDEALREDEQ